MDEESLRRVERDCEILFLGSNHLEKDEAQRVCVNALRGARHECVRARAGGGVGWVGASACARGCPPRARAQMCFGLDFVPPWVTC